MKKIILSIFLCVGLFLTIFAQNTAADLQNEGRDFLYINTFVDSKDDVNQLSRHFSVDACPFDAARGQFKVRVALARHEYEAFLALNLPFEIIVANATKVKGIPLTPGYSAPTKFTIADGAQWTLDLKVTDLLWKEEVVPVILLANETNAKGEAVAMYCSLETVQEFPKAADGIPKVCALIKDAIDGVPEFGDLPKAAWPIRQMTADETISSGVKAVLSQMAAKVAPKPLIVLFDEVDCLSDAALVSFAENGYKGTNLRDFAAGMGLSKSALYKHYESKEDIWNTVIGRMEAYYIDRFGSGSNKVLRIISDS